MVSRPPTDHCERSTPVARCDGHAPKLRTRTPAKSRILDRLMASPEQTIRSHRAGNRRLPGRQSRRIPPRPHSRSRFTAMCPARCRSLAPGRGGLPHHAQKASVAPVVGQRGHRCQVGRGPDRLEHPTRSPTLIISASMPLFRTVIRRAKQAFGVGRVARASGHAHPRSITHGRSFRSRWQFGSGTRTATHYRQDTTPTSAHRSVCVGA